MAEEIVLTAVSLNQEEAAVTIDTQDFYFVGQDVTLIIGIDSTDSEIVKTFDLFFTIAFNTDALSFNKTDF